MFGFIGVLIGLAVGIAAGIWVSAHYVAFLVVQGANWGLRKHPS